MAKNIRKGIAPGGCIRRVPPKMPVPRIVYVNGSDWAGIYVNGVLKAEGSTLSAKDALEALGLKPVEVTPDQNWLDKKGSLPENLVNVKRARV